MSTGTARDYKRGKWIEIPHYSPKALQLLDFSLLSMLREQGRHLKTADSLGLFHGAKTFNNFKSHENCNYQTTGSFIKLQT